MKKKIPADAFELYVSLGPGRSYQIEDVIKREYARWLVPGTNGEEEDT